MKVETQEKILKAWDQDLRDLDLWVKKLGRSPEEMKQLYDQVVRENGMAAKLIGGMAASVIPVPVANPRLPGPFQETIARIHSEDFRAQLLNEPEPTPEELSRILSIIKDPLPNLRQRFLHSGSLGPHHKRGGRHKELADPKLQRQICEEIKSLREPDSKLQDLYQRMADKYRVSPTTIKCIWHGYERNKMK